jgi:phosphatidate phosphatase PAH1
MAGFFMSGARFIKGAYDSLPEINAATLSGAIDIVVVEQVRFPVPCAENVLSILSLFLHVIAQS